MLRIREYLKGLYTKLSHRVKQGKILNPKTKIVKILIQLYN